MMRIGFCAVLLLMAISLTISACHQSNHQSKHLNANDNNAVITPDWGVAANVWALGGTVLAMGDVDDYALWVGKLPARPISLGLRHAPNAEVIRALDGVAIDTDFYAQARHLYQNPHTVNFNPPPTNTLDDYAQMTQNIGDIIQKSDAARAYNHAVMADLAKTRQMISHSAYHRVAIIQFADENHVRLYGDSSLFYPAVRAMGLDLVNLGNVGAWGFSTLRLDELSGINNHMPNADSACILVIKPFDDGALKHNLVWQKMALEQGCFKKLPSIWMYAGMVSIDHFNQAMQDALPLDNPAFDNPATIKPKKSDTKHFTYLFNGGVS